MTTSIDVTSPGAGPEAQAAAGEDRAELFRCKLEGMLADIRRRGSDTLLDTPQAYGPQADVADQASAEAASSLTFRLRDREYHLFRKVVQALQRLEDGTYGICEECGEPIAVERLLARPVTTLCLSCKQEQERDEELRQREYRPL